MKYDLNAAAQETEQATKSLPVIITADCIQKQHHHSSGQQPAHLWDQPKTYVGIHRQAGYPECF